MTLSNGSVIEGTFKDGKADGVHILTYPDGSKEMHVYKMDVLKKKEKIIED